MAFDGILVRALRMELAEALKDGRISKIAQPEKEELLLNFKTPSGAKRLLLSGSASLPLIYLTEENKPSPQTAPGFTMLLRKHIGSGRLLGISQAGLERALDFEFEALSELGDPVKRHLILEIMGKYSNIIFTDENMMILDAVRHVPPSVSSVRTVLPGHPYFLPETQKKADLLSEAPEHFAESLQDTDTLQGALTQHYTGLSSQSVSEFLYEAGFDASAFVSSLSPSEKLRYTEAVFSWKKRLEDGPFDPCIVYRDGIPTAYSAAGLPSYEGLKGTEVRHFSSPSAMLEAYLSEKNTAVNMRQRSQDMRRVIQNLIERSAKKLDLQQKQLQDTEKKEQLKIQGELLNAYSYQLPVGEKKVRVMNYYTGKEIDIPTDPDLSIADNAKKLFDRYGKLKRTAKALETLIPETEAELTHLQTILVSIDLAQDAQDLAEIREEMAEAGYIKRQHTKNGRKQKITSRPYHYRSSDGFDIYVGRNNTQNDLLTFRFAEGNDIFMHAKKMPGSHVIIRTGGAEVPDRTYEEAGALAAYYSAGRTAPKTEIDYVEKKQVKKPSGAKPGFVVYYTNYSLMASPDISGIERIE